MQKNLIAATAFVLLVGACNKSPNGADAGGANTIETSSPVVVAETPAAPVSLATSDFANAVAGSGKFEIDSAAVAAKKATSAQLKSLAAMISADHTKAGQELTAAAAASDPSFRPLASLSPKQKSDLMALEGASGADFDNLYITQQIAAHREAIAILTAYGASGASPQLKQFASETVPVVQKHLDQILPLSK